MKQILKILLVIILLSQTVSAANSTVYNIDKVSTTLTKTFENNIHTEINVIDEVDRITEINFKTAYNGSNTAYIIVFPTNNVTYYVKYTKYYEYIVIPYIQQEIYLTIQNASDANQSFMINTFPNQSFAIIPFIPMNFISKIEYVVTDQQTIFTTYPSIQLLNASKFTTSLPVGMPANKIRVDSITPFDLEITVTDIGIRLTKEQQISSLSTISGIIYYGYSKTIGFIFPSSNEMILDILSLLDILFAIIIGIFILVFIYPYLILMYIIIVINYKTIWESRFLKEFITNYGKNVKTVSTAAVYVGTILWYFMLQVVQTIVRIGSFLRQILQI